DIAPLLEDWSATAPDQDMRMLVFPVEPEGHWDYRRFVTPRVTGYFAPSGVELSTGPEDMTIRVAGTDFMNR
ncbi:MAG: hypothetical protein LIO68_06870, partial [Rikenellaceae bacterium]|nr:hypothetical protein [Rikenellaceae bacterium]